MKRLFILAILATMSACSHTVTTENPNQVYFAFDSAHLSDAAKEKLKEQSVFMKKNPEINVTVQGHCDERGSTEYNLALGALRAGNAAHTLIRNDIEPHRIKTISYGKEKPLYKGTGEKVWSKNRNATTVIREF